MSTLAVCLWIANVACDTIGRLVFKLAALGGEGELVAVRWKRLARSPALWIGIVCFCLEFVLWLGLLSLIPLSQAILIGSINIAAVAVAGRIFFRERLSAKRVAGITLIALGVALAGGFG